MDGPIYFPILRAKAGEIDAIGWLAPMTKGLVCPMLDFPKQMPDDKRSLANYLGEKIHEVTRSWGTGNEIYFDFSRYEPDVEVTDGQHVVDYVFEIARQSRLKAMPVVGPISMRGPGTGYFEAVSRVAARDGRGAAVRIPYDKFATERGLERVLKETLNLVSFPPGNADVFLDAGSLALTPEAARDDMMLADVVRRAIQSASDIGVRRTIFAASSLPDTLKRQPRGKVLEVPRIEFLTWRRLMRQDSSARLLYGDYGIIYPTQTEPERRVVPPSRIRGSTEERYFLYKGARDEIRMLSRTVVEDSWLSMVPACWGERAVRACADGYGDLGGPKDWVARDTNMHIEGTVAALRTYLPSAFVPMLDTARVFGQSWLQDSLFPTMVDTGSAKQGR